MHTIDNVTNHMYTITEAANKLKISRNAVKQMIRRSHLQGNTGQGVIKDSLFYYLNADDDNPTVVTEDVEIFYTREFADIIGIPANTLKMWDYRNKLIGNRTLTGRLYFTDEHFRHLPEGFGEIHKDAFRPKELANILGVSHHRIRNWSRRGLLDYHQGATLNRYYYTRDQVEQFLSTIARSNHLSHDGTHFYMPGASVPVSAVEAWQQYKKEELSS